MLRELKFWFAGMLAVTAVTSASAFALYGPTPPPAPDAAWQTEEIGYQEVPADGYYGGDIGTPRKLTEEYRWNTPIVYYAFDSAFLNYFGSNGVYAVEQAVALINGLTNASDIDLNAIPTDTTRFNFLASSIGLVDLKSHTLSQLLEELGLASAERWTWCLHDRLVVTPPPCPANVAYEVVKLNYDPYTFEPSSYVNGTLFSYVITENCTTPPATLADAYEFVVDPLSVSSAVAAPSLLAAAQLVAGGFYTGLTRDDVGGLRYLWRTNNMNVESIDSQATLINSTGTNGSTVQLIVTSNLADLVSASLTNNPGQLTALFPNLVIDSFTSSYQLVVSSNNFSYFTNDPYAPAGVAVLKTGTTYTTNVQQLFHYTFANVITNSYYTNGAVTLVQTNMTVGGGVWNPVGSTSVVATVSSQTSSANFVNGDYFILPTNTCGFEILTNLLTQVNTVENTVTATNAPGTTNIAGQSFSETTITYVTNHYLLVLTTPCTNATGTNVSVALRQGMNRITFVRRSYDSLLGQFFDPVTTNYTLKAIGGNQIYTETFRRTVTQPDFLFTVTDLAGIPGNNIIDYSGAARSSPQFVQSPQPAGGLGGPVAGPGIIQAPALITYNDVGPIFYNVSPGFDEASSTPLTAFWASFDGTTNAPVVYPSGTSLLNLENQVFIHVSPDTNALPSGTVGQLYSTQLNVTGGQPPYSWSLSPTSAGLPPGLALSSTGVISGTPTQADTFDNIIVRLSDSSARLVDRTYSITINSP